MSQPSPDAAPQLPNPMTPMAFFPPELAFQVSVSIYVLVGSMVILLWDCLNTLSADWKLVRRFKFTIPTFVYFFSRATCLAYLLGGAIFFTAPLGNCKSSGKIIGWIYPLAIPSTSLLFFFRVRAMYRENKWMVGFFSIMWLAVLGGSLTASQGVTATSIGTTNYCTNEAVKDYVALSGFIPFMNDTLIFFAITWRLMRSSYADQSVMNDFKTALFGKHLPAFSRGLLQDGQAYYLSTVVINILNTAIFYNTSIPIAYRTALTMPNIALMNIMACRVYRKTKFGIYREGSITDIQSSSNGGPDDRRVDDLPPIVFRQRATFQTGRDDGNVASRLSFVHMVQGMEDKNDKNDKEDEKILHEDAKSVV